MIFLYAGLPSPINVAVQKEECGHIKLTWEVSVKDLGGETFLCKEVQPEIVSQSLWATVTLAPM